MTTLRITGRSLWLAATRPVFWRILFLFLVVGLPLIRPAGAALAQTPVPPAGGGGGSGLAGITTSLANMGKIFVDFLIGVAAILLAIGLATGFVQGQAATMFGMPHALASTWMKLAGIVICFIGAILSIAVANAIIDAMSGFQSSDGIHIPGQAV
ncbi:MAG: hypothetical protein KKA73_19060 [Chloroflexi bacterium]|nr:hypothetical protein [Chloroflexota bacterium]